MELKIKDTIDHPGVVVRPPVLYAATLATALILGWVWPMPMFPIFAMRVFGLALVALGVVGISMGRKSLSAVGTNVSPFEPTTTIVTSGVYSYSRNPLYVCLTLVYFGLTLTTNNGWGIPIMLPVLGVMHFGVVVREEKYLERKFGALYRQYRHRVRRYI